MSEIPKIAVDLKRMSELCGLPKWPEWAQPRNERQCMALRVITDALDPKVRAHPDIIVHNATAWIDRAFDAGKRLGIEMERRRWETKIRKLFDLAEGRED